jgi:hypothetical protein
LVRLAALDGLIGIISRALALANMGWAIGAEEIHVQSRVIALNHFQAESTYLEY